MSKKIILLIIFLIFLLIMLVIVSLSQNKKAPNSIPTPTSSPKIGVPNLPDLSTPKPGAGIETPEFKQAEKEFIDNTPILQKLPANSTYFDIEYKDERHLSVLSKTDNKVRDYQVAKNWFIENNIDINQITVEYK